MRRSFFAVLLTFACLLGSGEARAASLELQVVSYNVYMVPITAPARAERLEKLPDEIAELSPDVVLLQEVWSEADSASLEASLKRRGLSHVFRAASAAPFAYASSGMLIASRYPITAAQRRSFSLGRYPHTPYHLDWIGRKGALDVRIQTPLGPVRFVDTHLQASYRTGSYEPVRISQALELASWLTDTSLPLVVAGDFRRVDQRSRLPTELSVGHLSRFARFGLSAIEPEPYLVERRRRVRGAARHQGDEGES